MGRLPRVTLALASLIMTMPLQAVSAVQIPQAGGVNATEESGLLLPDLGMAPLRKFGIEPTVDGHVRLRFTTVIINIGDGPVQMLGHTPQANGDLLVDERIAKADGTWETEPSDFRMYYAGDGHNHWHLRDLETYELRNTDGTLLSIGAKHGFCFFDGVDFNLALPGAPQSETYLKTGCGKVADTSITMGLSVGWGDNYISSLPDQYIDITGLPSGEYDLTATADEQGFIPERCEANNSTTAILQIEGNVVTIVDPGEPSKACAS